MSGRFRLLSVMALAVVLSIPGMVASAASPSAQTKASAASSARTLVMKKFQSRKWLREHDRLRRKGGKSFGSSVSPAMFECGFTDCHDVRNVREDGRPWYKIKGQSVISGDPGVAIGVSFQHGVANGISNKFGLSAEFLSFETGVNITLSWSATVQGSTDPPPGECRELVPYLVYQDYRAEMWKKFPTDSHWTFVGHFRFWEFVGTGFRAFKVACK